MCTVEVALIADVLRLSNGQRFRTPGVPPRSICRRLFTDEHGESPTACVNRLEADIENQVRQRWNFDFRTETPLPGRYQWVPVHSGGVPPKASSELPKTAPLMKTSSEKQPQTTLSQRTKKHSRTAVTQSKITDFLHQRKRHRTLDSDLPCSKPLKTRRIAEQTSPSVVTIE